MIGLDTGFLVAWAIPEHAAHSACRLLAGDATRQGRTFGLTTGITEVWTLNPDDFAIFGCFSLWSPKSV